MNWTLTTTKLPTKKRRYPVIINCDGKLKDAYSLYHPDKKKFHFDMVHINWYVVAWFDLPEFENKLM